MTRTLGVLIGIVLVLAVAWGVMMVAMPEARPSLPELGGVGRLIAEKSDGAARTEGPGAFEEVLVTVEIPPAAELPDLDGCPADQVRGILGIELGAMHGIGVSAVSPEGPAARAGIQPGDSIAKCKGELLTCPMTLLPHVQPGETAREVEFTLRRAKTQEPESSPTETSPTDEQVGK